MSDFWELIASFGYIYLEDIFIYYHQKKNKVVLMDLISLNIPKTYLQLLEVLVEMGKFPNRSVAIRVGIRDLIKAEFLLDEAVKKKKNEGLIETEIENEFEENFII